LEDAGFNLENYILKKVEAGFRAAISWAILAGSGLGQPRGLAREVPQCETAAVAPAGAVTLNDLIMLKAQIPPQWQSGSAWYMNSNTWGQIMALGDVLSRPYWGQLPGGEPGLTLLGAPVRILNQLPSIEPGSTPILFGDLREAYVVVSRGGLAMRSVGWCVTYYFSMRVGGACLCANALRWLRVR
jgi:HK97 family phage major capsid protein